MKVIIIEDELTASDHLVYQLNSIDPSIEVIKILDSVQSSVGYFSDPNDAELIFMDIHLADGISFEIFDRVEINTPIIFTTAYNQYAIQAFKVNSVDYLLKPINEDELTDAIDKFRSRVQNESTSSINDQIKNVYAQLQSTQKAFKTNFLAQRRDELIPVKTEDIAYFYIEDSLVKLVTFDKKSFIYDKKLESIEEEIDPDQFYRINRQFIMNRSAIQNVKFYFNGKLVVNSIPKFEDRIVVSKAKASDFKKWLNS